MSRLDIQIAFLLTLAAVLAPTARASDSTAADGRRKQEIVFAEIPGHSAADAPFDIHASATSGLPVVLGIVSGPASLDKAQLTLTGEPGLVIVRASQAGNAVFLPATDAERAFSVGAKPSPPAFTAQPEPADATVGTPIIITVSVSGEPAPALQWRKDGTQIIGATSRTLTIVQAAPSDTGGYDVVATNPSGRAVSQRASVSVGKRSQFLNFQTPGGVFIAGQPVTLNASASSGLAVQFQVISGVAFLTGTTLTAQGGGTVTVQASQPGDSRYEAASPVSQTLVFAPGQGHY